MNGAATLVSGGTGFVGRFIVEHLLATGHAVAVMGRTAPPEGVFSAPIKFVEGTLDPARDQSMAFEDIDFFIHAAFDHVPGKYRGGEGDDAAGFRLRNREGSAALFKAARAMGVKRTVFLSSRAVYGTQPAGAVLTEETMPHPDTLYGEMKLAAERDLRDMSGDGFCGTSLRVTGVYGPAGTGLEHKWTGLFRDYLAGRSVEPHAGTEVHGDDVAKAVKLVLEAPEKAVSGQIFNISDLLIDRRDLLSVASTVARCRHPLPSQADRAATNVMATEKIRALGWRPGGVVALEQFVRSQVAGGTPR
ncbi:NAD-dependent epimerase/dehydratase family protein [Mesorhizobium sp. ZC-5]|uniref:NAD-dependent epimerase/dehydratase family protein n=1 Tax=Mesorhizobium sp. ZC-5 TaxID=2986066 RepID=UPI0021E7B041|nr:NAD(P)-dependent oxidoreductase [Mesorhizobium sp. ZC-5]MCV3242965.1 NAD(P)-dependent oxidoreductase [Mesorhizobium sp. ZC-5]